MQIRLVYFDLHPFRGWILEAMIKKNIDEATAKIKILGERYPETAQKMIDR